MTGVRRVTGAEVWPAVERLLDVGEGDSAIVLARLAVQCGMTDCTASAQAARPALLRLGPILRERDKHRQEVLDAIRADPTLHDPPQVR